jgi:hypothetical protein
MTLKGAQGVSWHKIPDDLTVMGEAPAPAHRQGLRLWLCSAGMRGMVLAGAGAAVASFVFFWPLYQDPLGFMMIIPATLAWMWLGRSFLQRLQVFLGLGMTARQRKWCLHRLRISGQDPDPLFITLHDMQVAIGLNEALVKSGSERNALNASTPLPLGQPRASRL